MVRDKTKQIYKIIRTIPEELKSDFQKLLDEQTNTILGYLKEQKENINRSDYEKLRLDLEKEHIKRNELEDKEFRTRKKLDEKEKECDSLKEVCARLEMKVSEVEKEKKRIEDRIDELKEKEAEKTKEIQHFISLYKDIDQSYLIYRDLSADLRTRMRPIFRNDSVYGFLSAVSNEDNVFAVWSYAKEYIKQNKGRDTDKLVALFEFLLNAYNVCGDGKYQIFKPVRGERFDSDKHLNIGRKTDGNISRVRLAGIKDTYSGKIVKRAIVEITE